MFELIRKKNIFYILFKVQFKPNQTEQTEILQFGFSSVWQNYSSDLVWDFSKVWFAVRFQPQT